MPYMSNRQSFYYRMKPKKTQQAVISTKWPKSHSSAVSVVLFGTFPRVNHKTPIAIHQKIPFEDYGKLNFCIQGRWGKKSTF